MLIETRLARDVLPDLPTAGLPRAPLVARSPEAAVDPAMHRVLVLLTASSLVGLAGLLAYPQAFAPGAPMILGLAIGLPALGLARHAGGGQPRLAASAFAIGVLAVLWALHTTLHLLPAYLGRGLPLRDEALARLDGALGFDWPAYFAWLRARPTLWAAGAAAYASTAPVGLAVALLLAWRGDTRRLCLFLTALILSAFAVYAVAIAVPAHGAYVRSGLGPADHPGLAVRFGAFQGEAIARLRAGTADLHGGGTPLGIIAFPSFHAVTCGLYAWALWGTGLRWPVVLLQAAVLAATPVQGAHYAVDVLAGLAIAAGAVALAHRLAGRRRARAGAGGIGALGPAFANSVRGLRRGLASERALRQEAVLLAAAAPTAMILAPTWPGRAALLGAVLGVVVVELINTAIEKLCDRVTRDRDEAIGFVKDLGSAAVLIALVAAGLVWAAFALARLGWA